MNGSCMDERLITAPVHFHDGSRQANRDIGSGACAKQRLHDIIKHKIPGPYFISLAEVLHDTAGGRIPHREAEAPEVGCKQVLQSLQTVHGLPEDRFYTIRRGGVVGIPEM